MDAQLKVQNKKIEEYMKSVAKQLSRSEMPPSQFCKEYSTILFHFQNNELIDSVIYSRTPRYIQKSFSGVVDLYKNENWKELIPGSGKDFYIIQPFLMQSTTYDKCPDTISKKAALKMTMEDIHKLQIKNHKLYLMEILKMEIFH